jgi:hypothetical protein
MAKVKVWNDNSIEHVEMFKGDQIRIPPNGFILMERDEAVAFKGAFIAPIINDGNANPKTFKKIRLTPVEGEVMEPKAIEPICQSCAYKASSDKDLLEHIGAMHKDAGFVDVTAEKEIEARKRGRPAKAAG